MFHKDNFRIVVVVERKSRKGGQERRSADRGGKSIYIYIFTVISRIHRPSPRSWSVNRRPILRPILVHRGGLANSIGERKRRYEAGIRIPPKTVPLSFQRLDEYVAISSSPPPSSFQRERKLWMKPAEREEKEEIVRRVV